MDIDFNHIVERNGSKNNSFEEMCCQLANLHYGESSRYTRIDGKGGDGGVEAIIEIDSGKKVGIQAKYVFDVTNLVKQLKKSIDAALNVYTKFEKYIVCIPFDLSGPTGRKGKSAIQKVQDLLDSYKVQVQEKRISFEIWSKSVLTQRILRLDVNGGMRQFFFNGNVLSEEWFSNKLASAEQTAGPRYSRELNVETELYWWMQAFGKTDEWKSSIESKISSIRDLCGQISEGCQVVKPNPFQPLWPEQHKATALVVVDRLETWTSQIQLAHVEWSASGLDELRNIAKLVSTTENGLLEELKREFGDEFHDTVRFREFHSEFNAAFPAANLDSVRELKTLIDSIDLWIESPQFYLSTQKCFVLTGDAGVGKTHGICDTVKARLSSGSLSCLVFGHQFGAQGDPWLQIADLLGLHSDNGTDGILDQLDAAGRAAGKILIVFVDALNETKPNSFWRNNLASFIHASSTRDFVKVCVSCRSSYLSYCLPRNHDYEIVCHQGFKGVEQGAVNKHFEHFGLLPPISPILHPEFSNPLFLRLVCKSLELKGLDQMPVGWKSMFAVIKTYLEELEIQFSTDFGVSERHKLVSKCLSALAKTLIISESKQLTLSSSVRCLEEISTGIDPLRVIDWLLSSNLLIDDVLPNPESLTEDSLINFAFERLGDFLIAFSLSGGLSHENVLASCEVGGAVHEFIHQRENYENYPGVIQSLSILVPEVVEGCEAVDLLEDSSLKHILHQQIVESIPFRDPGAFSESTEKIIWAAIRTNELCELAFKNLLALCWFPSRLDSLWIDWFLNRLSMVERDRVWCFILYKSYSENASNLKTLIERAAGDNVTVIDKDMAFRWAVGLLWFTASPDLRIRHGSARGATNLMSHHPSIVKDILRIFLHTRDHSVCEMALLGAYGALLTGGDHQALKDSASVICEMIDSDSVTKLQHAQIRDLCTSILYYAKDQKALNENCNIDRLMQPIEVHEEFEIATEEEIEEWESLPGLVASCLHMDFAKYTLNMLTGWSNSNLRGYFGHWILNRVITEFGYADPGIIEYDKHVMWKYGAGRGKEVWAERIGKKYQWISLNHLASWLHDSVERVDDNLYWNEFTIPQILTRLRKFDPTMPTSIALKEREKSVWWIPDHKIPMVRTRKASERWVEGVDNVLTLGHLTSIVTHGDSKWRILTTFPEWREEVNIDDEGTSTLENWAHVKGYVVPLSMVDQIFGALEGRNFFNNWMPQGISYHEIFMGEYPWGTNLHPEDESEEYDTIISNCIPTWNDVSGAWEYDKTLPDSYSILAPGSSMMEGVKLQWNRSGGFNDSQSVTIFQDPSLLEGGPSTLLVSSKFLNDYLAKNQLSIIWTLLGEKMVIPSDRTKEHSIVYYSQVGALTANENLRVGKVYFFRNSQENVGLAEKYKNGDKDI